MADADVLNTHGVGADRDWQKALVDLNAILISMPYLEAIASNVLICALAGDDIRFQHLQKSYHVRLL
jgi:hypothetical protein